MSPISGNKMGRPDHIQDALIRLHNGPWYGWSDPGNKIYANLIIKDASKDKPTESELTTKLAELQAAYDAEAYKRNREAEYPSVQEQLDMLYHDQVDSTTTFKTAIKTVKDKYPKP